MISPKPCPFCGKMPVIEPTNPKVQGNAWGRVKCMNKECVAQPRVDDGEEVSDNRGSNAYKEAAIIRWNTRKRGDCMKQFILYYPPGSTVLDSGEEVTNNNLARQILEDLHNGKSIALDRDSGWLLSMITEDGITIFGAKEIV